MRLKKHETETLCVHAGNEPDEQTGALNVPIIMSSTFKQISPGVNKGFDYSRSGNPTRDRLEKCIAELENGNFGLSFASGLAATDAILRLLDAGDAILTTENIYGGTYRYFEKISKRCSNIDVLYCDFNDDNSYFKKCNSKVKMIWIETPTNPILEIINIQKIANFANERGIIFVVDNTFATPYLQNPLDLNADIVIHSATKYINGHCDIIMGLIALKSEVLFNKLKFLQNAIGAVPSPFDCYMALRGIKTLHLRVEKQCENSKKIAIFLKAHSKVRHVNYPGLKTHINHELAIQQMKKFGGIVSFEIDGDKSAVFRFLKKLKIFILAVSLGCVESLVSHPATMSHSAVPLNVQKILGINDSLVRLSVGIENDIDLIQDLEQALSVV